MTEIVLDEDFRSDLRFFAFWLGNTTLLATTNYFDTLLYDEAFIRSPELIGHIFAVYLNNYRAYTLGVKRNPKKRAEQWLISLLVPNYPVDPPIEAWETRLTDDIFDYFAATKIFAVNLGHKALAPEIPADIGYIPVLFDGGSFMEAIFAIFSNNLRVDPQNIVLNHKHAQKRAAQYIRQTLDPSYIVAPPFETWEGKLL